MKLFFTAVIFFMLSATINSNAQEKKPLLVRGNFDNLPIVEFFQKIESQTPASQVLKPTWKNLMDMN